MKAYIFMRIFCLTAFVFFVEASEICEYNDTDIVESLKNPRLSDSVVPRHYSLNLRLGLSDDGYSGDVTIEANVTKTTLYLVLHSRDLEVHYTKVLEEISGKPVPIEKTFHFEPNDFYVIQFLDEIRPGSYIIVISYSTNYSTESKGFYKRQYVGSSNQTDFFASTNLEPDYARSVFPCFDEPRFMATFSLTVVHEPRYTALSNAAIKRTTGMNEDNILTEFANTSPMATHSLALFIGNLSRDSNTVNGVEISVYNLDEPGDFKSVLGIVGRLLDHHEHFYCMKYPLEKLDIVRIPDDEWNVARFGLITVRKFCMDVGEDKLFLRWMGNEIGRMWLGQLVAFDRWDDTWIEGAFAYLSSEKVLLDSEDDIFEFLEEEEEYQWMIRSRPLVDHVRIKDKILERSQKKGAKFLEMLGDIIEEDFHRGVCNFVKKYSNTATNASSLWMEMNSTLLSGEEVNQMMRDIWRRRNMVPILNVKRDTGHTQTIILEQRHFLCTERRVILPSTSHGFTELLLAYYTSHEGQRKAVHLDYIYKILNVGEYDWIKFNPNHSGYFITNYDMSNWKTLTDILHKDHTMLSSRDRANLLYDSFVLAEYELLSWDVFLNMSFYLRHETDFLPWRIARQLFRRIESMEHENFGEFYERENYRIKSLSSGSPIYEHIKLLLKPHHDSGIWTIPETPGRFVRLQSILTDLSCRSKYLNCLEIAQEKLTQTITDDSIKTVPFIYGSESTNKTENENVWQFVRDLYLEETSPWQKLIILETLASFTGTLAVKTFDLFIEDESLSKEHFFLLLVFGKRKPEYDAVLRKFTSKSVYEKVKSRFGTNVELFGQFMGQVLSSEESDQLSKVMMLASEETNPILQRYLKEGVGKIKRNAIFRKQHRDSIRKWQESHIRMPWLSKRLPSSMGPSMYDLHLFVDLNQDDFSGKVNVYVDAVEDFQEILIHSHELIYSSIVVYGVKTGNIMDIDESFLYEPSMYLVIRFRKALPSGLYGIQLEFNGRYNMNEVFGLSKITSDKNSTNFVVYTKLEPDGARMVFPCFDEPHLKAKFRVTVVHNPEVTALSNMPEENRVMRPDGFAETSFSLSPTMSTYLVAIVVSDFNYSETSLVGGQKLRYFAPPEIVNYTEEAINTIPKSLHMLEEMFNDTFTYPKLDFVVLPSFLGGMENWGLVSLQSTKLLRPDMDLHQFYVAERTVVHELVHHWFGNLVTMNWWSDIWLNEAFSDYYAVKVMRSVSPIVDQMKTDEKLVILSRHSVRPLIHAVESRPEIKSLFDRITYTKGSALVEMLENSFGETFQTGVKNYLKKFSYKNANTDNLWEELSKVLPENFNVTEMMYSWTRESYNPVVKIVRNGSTFTAVQEAFKHKNERHAASSNRILWHIPLTYKNLDTGETTLNWLKEKEATFPINGKPEHTLKFNHGAKGFYLVQYDTDTYRELEKKLLGHHEAFSEVDRLHLLTETIVLVRQDYIPIEVLLNLTKYLKNETSFFVWRIFARYIFPVFMQQLIRQPVYPLAMKYIDYLTDNIYASVRGNKTEIKEFSEMISKMACRVGNKVCMESHSETFKQWLQNETVNSDSLENYFRHMQNDDYWLDIMNQFTASEANSTRRNDLGTALILCNDKTLLEKTLQYILEREEFSGRDLINLWDSFFENPNGFDVILDSLESNWTIYKNMFPEGILVGFLSEMSSRLISYEEMNKVKRLSRCHPEDIPEKSLSPGLQSAKQLLKWTEKKGKYLSDWIFRNVPLLVNQGA